MRKVSDLPKETLDKLQENTEAVNLIIKDLQEQTARLYELMGINAELTEIKGALLKRGSKE